MTAEERRTNNLSKGNRTSESRVGTTTTKFVDDVGIADTLTSDGAMEMVSPRTDFIKGL